MGGFLQFAASVVRSPVAMDLRYCHAHNFQAAFFGELVYSFFTLARDFQCCRLCCLRARDDGGQRSSPSVRFDVFVLSAAVHFLRRGSAGVESELRELRVLHRDLKNKKKELALRLKQKRQRDARLMAKVRFLGVSVVASNCLYASAGG